MRFADTVHGLLRRWYIVFPGIIVAAAMVFGAWFAIPPGYNRSATQLLIPGANSIPDGANPYLFLGGLAPAADVLVRAVGSENVLNEMTDDYPGVDITISRDTTTAGPIIHITVTGHTDSDAEKVLDLLVQRTATVLEDFQQEENIPARNRMTVIPITVDDQSVLEQRSRIVGAAGAGVAGLLLTLLAASVVEGLSHQRQRRETESSADDNETDERDFDPAGVTEPASAVASPTGVPALDGQPADEQLTAEPAVPSGQ